MACKNIFTQRPITKLECLWGRAHREAVEELLENSMEGETSVLLGPRRIGKTSVVLTMLELFKSKGHYIYFNFSRFLGTKAISIADITPQKTSLKFITTSKAYKFSLKGVEVEVRKTSINEFVSDFSTLVRVFSENTKRGVIVFDEAQVLARLKNLDFRGLIQEIIDTYTNISLIFTGSMPGLLVNYLNPSPDRPNFMRGARTITLGRWSTEEGVEYLKSGFGRDDPRFPRIVESLGGIPGFLAYFGLTALNMGYPERDTLDSALTKTLEYAKEEWRRDIGAFLALYNSPIYTSILKILARSEVPLRGSEIYKLLEEKPKRIQHVYKYLKNLEKAGFVKSSGKRYWIEDPVLKLALL
ncbi:ATP-binding protein [Pyrococcus kukulkanii]|uniref:AAA family ATPase n=1 Tax=Pyrococcus kukulkanii TaxID=1609559 RepID=UPI003564A2C2